MDTFKNNFGYFCVNVNKNEQIRDTQNIKPSFNN